jgi:hypothetical protein
MVMKVVPRWHIDESGMLLHSLFVLATRVYQNDEDLYVTHPRFALYILRGRGRGTSSG